MHACLTRLWLTVIDGMRALGFDAYVTFLQIYLAKYRDVSPLYRFRVEPSANSLVCVLCRQ